MDVKSEVIEIIDELFMEDVSDMMDEDLFDAGVLDSMGTVELIVELESRFDIRVPVSEFGRDDWNTANKIVEGVTELRNAKAFMADFWSSNLCLGLGSGSYICLPTRQKT